jgi:hypothetical protein
MTIEELCEKWFDVDDPECQACEDFNICRGDEEEMSPEE